jgi:hypothetical protein
MLPKFFPIRLSRRPEPFDSDEYLYELKIDGFRALAHISEGKGRVDLAEWEHIPRFRGTRDVDRRTFKG